jgi:hypothetical protein
MRPLAFYHDVLGFGAGMKSAAYAIISRDGQTIHFMKAASEDVMRCARGHAEIYIEVGGIDLLWEHVKSLKDCYRTEFHIEDPNGCLVFVGEETSVRKHVLEG